MREKEREKEIEKKKRCFLGFDGCRSGVDGLADEVAT